MVKNKGVKKSEKGVISDDELEREVEGIEKSEEGEIRNYYEIKASKSVAQLKKGDKIIIDSNEYEVDAHYILIDHGTTKEMAIELFDPKTDKDYQLRYFSDQTDNTLELYELQEIMYFKKPFSRISW